MAPFAHRKFAEQRSIKFCVQSEAGEDLLNVSVGEGGTLRQLNHRCQLNSNSVLFRPSNYPTEGFLQT